MSWFNFGGGHLVTRAGYNLDLLRATLNGFQARHPGVEMYLEPGAACALNAGVLAASVLDIVHNEIPIAILDASCACHTPDVMEMPYRPRVQNAAEPGEKPHTFRLAGPSCLAGDIFGDYSFDAPLQPGDRVVFEDMAHYTLVKTNTFNGINLPDIYLQKMNGEFQLLRSFGYDDFISRL